MARMSIKNISRVDKFRNNIHDKVYTTYTIFMEEGEKFIQFDMYGREGRENPEKISQSIQIDRETAKFIVNLLTLEFELK